MNGCANHVLVVDDDRSIRETLRAVLQEEGYEVLEAEDGLAALRILQTRIEPMVVLLDLRMPLLDGTGVLAAVAEDAALMSLYSFVMITANLESITDKTARLLQQLFVPVIPKPFELDELLDAVAIASCRQVASTVYTWTDTSPHQAVHGAK